MQDIQTEKMPVFFIGHGSPMNAIADNDFTRALAAMGQAVGVPPWALLVVSAHWLTNGSFVATTPQPETIYDFYGFPEELYRLTYPAPGAPEVAREAAALAGGLPEDQRQGLDHGAWAVLRHLFPKADIPAFQLSIDYHRPMDHHFALAQKLYDLRRRGVLVIGSGNIVHNLQLYFHRADDTPYGWNIEFDALVKERILQRDFKSLLDYRQFGKAAELSVPTVDHYVPLLYSLALADDEDSITFPHEGLERSMSMRCLRIG